MSDFKKGDIVRLRSGGPDMTVTAVGGIYEGQEITATWFDPKGLQSGGFSPEALKHVEEDEEGDGYE